MTNMMTLRRPVRNLFCGTAFANRFLLKLYLILSKESFIYTYMRITVLFYMKKKSK